MPAIRKHTQNKIIDLVSFICMTGLLFSGIILRFNLPPRSHGETLWGLTRHEWGDIHFWLAAAFVVIIVIHLALHASWIKASFLPSGPKKRGNA